MTLFIKLTLQRVWREGGKSEPCGYPALFNFRLVDRFYALEAPDEDSDAPERSAVIMDGEEFYVAETVEAIEAALNASQEGQSVDATGTDVSEA